MRSPGNSLMMILRTSILALGVTAAFAPAVSAGFITNPGAFKGLLTTTAAVDKLKGVDGQPFGFVAGPVLPRNGNGSNTGAAPMACLQNRNAPWVALIAAPDSYSYFLRDVLTTGFLTYALDTSLSPDAAVPWSTSLASSGSESSSARPESYGVRFDVPTSSSFDIDRSKPSSERPAGSTIAVAGPSSLLLFGLLLSGGIFAFCRRQRGHDKQQP